MDLGHGLYPKHPAVPDQSLLPKSSALSGAGKKNVICCYLPATVLRGIRREEIAPNRRSTNVVVRRHGDQWLVTAKSRPRGTLGVDIGVPNAP